MICSTPRSGSTLLCEMLWASGVAGRPNSFFREQSILYWAHKWGVAHQGDVETHDFNGRYMAAMLREGRAGTSIFGLRVMFQSLAELERRLTRLQGGKRDVVARIADGFGPTLFIHLTRQDRIGQAISRLRAEQSGLWHRASDGSVLEGPASPAPVAYDAARLAGLIEEVAEDEAGWTRFFSDHAIAPLRLDYDSLSADPHVVVGGVLSALGQDRNIAASVPVPTKRLSDATSRDWSERFRRDMR